MKTAKTKKLDMDDYLSGVPLGDALLQFAPPELVRECRHRAGSRSCGLTPISN
jgi:hypothetical protein